MHSFNCRLFVFIIAFIAQNHSDSEASEWMQCYVVDYEGYVDTLFLLDQGNIYLYYRHPNVAPLDYNLIIDGVSVYTHSTFLPELADGAPVEEVNGNLVISTQTQQSLGIGNHTLALMVTTGDATVYDCTITFGLIEEVSGVYAMTSKWYAATHEKFGVMTFVESGLPRIIEWAVLNEDRMVVLVKETKRSGEDSRKRGVEEIKISLSYAGSYTIQVTVYNELSLAIASTDITIQEPIRELSVNTNSPRRYPDMLVNFDLVFEDVPLPSSVHYDVLFGDGALVYDTPVVDGVSDVSFEHSYNTPGLYNVRLSAYNQVSHRSVTVKVGVLQDIRDVSLMSYTKQNGYNQPQDILPMEYPVKLFANVTEGTVELSLWYIGSIKQINTTSVKLWYKFPAAGYYNVSVTAWNTFSESTAISSLRIMESVTSLYLVNNGPVHLGNNMTYVLFCKQRGTTPSYRVDFGDGTERGLPVPEQNLDVVNYLPNSVKVPFDPLVYYSTVFSHLYQVEGHYIAIATGSNLVTHLTSLSDAFVQLRPCQIPDINIRDGGSNYNLATKYKRNKSFLFAAKVDLDCQGAKKADYQWQIYTIDDIFSVPSATNKFHLPDSINAKVTDLYIPKYVLDYGRYIFELTVVMFMKDGSIGVSNRDQSYIEVVESPLMARISGGSAIRIGWSSNITLDGSESHDPDIIADEAFDGLHYNWYCHLSNETFNQDDIDISQELPEEGGCLGSGFQLQSGNSSTLLIEAGTVPGNQTYTFYLAINKTERTSPGWAKQVITVMPGHPPALTIKCLQNCDSHMNPSHRFALMGACTDCGQHTKNKYIWSFTNDNNNLTSHLAEFRRVSYGQSKAYLSLPINMFAGSETYTLRFQIESFSGASSLADYTFNTNAAPSMGTCHVTPPEGVVLETKFDIECYGFTDPEGPLVYEAHSYTGAESSAMGNTPQEEGTLLYYGVDPLFPPTLLPIGIASNDYNVSINIKVIDTLGASVETTVVVKVIQPNAANQQEPLEDTALRLAQGEDSELHQLVHSGSMQSATQLINTVTSMLNAEATKSQRDKEALTEDEQNVKVEKRIQARESLIDSLMMVEVRNMESLEQTSAAMAQVTQQQQEVSLEAQVKMTDTYIGMGQFLKEQSNSGVGGQIVESSARFLVSGLSNMMGAANAEVQHDKLQNKTMDGNYTEAMHNRTMKARNVTLAAMASLQDIQTAILHNKVPGEEPAELITDSLSVLLSRQENWQLDDLALESKDGGFLFQLPIGMHSLIDESDGEGGREEEDDIIDTQMYHFKNNPFSWTPGSKQVTGQVTSLQLRKSDQSEVAIKNLPQDINIILANDKAAFPSPLLPSIDQVTNQTLYAFNRTNVNSSVLIQVDPDPFADLDNHGVDVEMDQTQPELKVCIQFDNPPNSTHNGGCILLPQQMSEVNSTMSTSTDVSQYSWLLQPDDLEYVGMYFVTIDTVQNLEVWHNHTVYAYSTQCLYWDDKAEEWSGGGCKVGPYTSLTHTHCQCDHLTAFALSFFVLPNALNIAHDITQFLQFVDNPVTVVAVVTVFIMYAISSIWARRKDSIEQQQTKMIFLTDNDPKAHYRYHVTVFTGMRKNAGTTATVTLTLQGTFGSSNPHILTAKDQTVLQQNSIDSFLITTYQSLGQLTSIRVWHNNMGSSPDWYVSRILVHDLESDLWWYFLCRSWLSVTLGDSKLDKIFPVATEQDLNEFHNLVLSQTMRDLKDNHLWFSVFVKPPQSYFTRLQRASCCLSLLLTSMMVNIMFYGVPEDPELQNLELGTVQISTTTILIGVEASLISVPLSIAIVTLFRNARPRYVALPDPMMSHSDTSLFFITSKMLTNLGASRIMANVGRLRHFFSQEFHSSKTNLEMQQLVSEPNHSDISSSSRSWSGCQTPSTPSLEISRANVRPSSSRKVSSTVQIMNDMKMNDGNIEMSSVLVVPVDEESDQWSVDLKDSVRDSVQHVHNHSVVAIKTDKSTEASGISRSDHVQSGSLMDRESVQASDSIDNGVIHGVGVEDNDFSKFDENSEIQLLDAYQLDNDIDNLECSIKQELSKSTTNSQDHDRNSIVLSCSWDRSEDTIIYETHQDYLSSKLNECRTFLYNMPASEFTNEKEQQKVCKKLNLALTMHGWDETSHTAASDANMEEDINQGCLPWWVIYIAWALTLSSSIVFAFFIMMYGLRYGKQTSLDWLVAMVVGLIQSVVIIQPIKVVVLAAIFAIALRTHQLDDVGAQFFRNWRPIKITESSENTDETYDSCQRYKLTRLRNSCFYAPPSTSTIVKAQEKRRVAAKIHSMFRAFLGQIVFIFFILEIAYAQQNRNSFYMGQAMRDRYNEGLEEVSTLGDFYSWMSDEFIPKIFKEDLMELQDSNLLLGSVRVRQVRVKTGVCEVPSAFSTSISSCKSPMKISNVDKDSYGPSWLYKSTKKNSKGLWSYQGASVVQGSYYHVALMGFDNGGYIADLGTDSSNARKVLTKLKDKGWADQNTRAFFVEWTVYSGNMNLFSVNTIMFQADETGSLRSSSEFAIMRIHRYISKYDIFMRSLEAIYVFVVIVMIYRDYNKWKLLGKDYLDFWNGLNLIIIALSICTIGLYALRHAVGMEAMAQHKQNPQEFVSFARVAFVNQLVIQLIALIVFFATLKCAKVLRYNTSIFMLQKALHNVSKQFMSFTVGIAIALLAFASYAFLTFSSALFDFKTFLTSFEALFVGITGGFEHMEGVVQEFPIQGFIFFVLLAFFVLFIIFNIYVSFILSAFTEAKNLPDDFADHDVVAALVNRILHFFALDTHSEASSDIQKL